MRQVDFVLMLHSHLPYVLNHGRWPHGSDWLCEAAIETYLPLLEKLRHLDAGNVAAPLTIGFTPILANQLEHRTFARELECYFAQRLAACARAATETRASPDESLAQLVTFWDTRLRRLHSLWEEIGGDVLGEFRRLQDKERLEITTSAATHPFLPLLGRDESLRLQLALGRSEHRRLFRRHAEGCWVPECGYRPRGMWSPMAGAPNAGVRRGVEEFLADAGFRYFFTDAHMAHAGAPLGVYGQVVGGGPERFATPGGGVPAHTAKRSPYRAYRVSGPRSPVEVGTLVRDPRSSMRVWSRSDGYPGDGAYLEFHRMRWPDGLRLWRVTSRTSELGEKAPYNPLAARLTASAHAADFAALLAHIAVHDAGGGGSVITAPFDTELFGHWWFEGPDFLGDLYTRLPDHPQLRAVTATEHLDGGARRAGIRLTRGSWGRDGDYTMWLNDRVQWMWPIVWQLENQFWDLAPRALAQPALHPLLEQSARSLLLVQSSDWPFIVSTGEVADYATARFGGHAKETGQLLAALQLGVDGGDVGAGVALAEELQQRDDVFREILPAIRWALEPGDWSRR